MDTGLSTFVRSRRLYWTATTILLLPLAVFWIGVITQSRTISRWLLGPTHTPMRDLLPTVVLPLTALMLSVARLRVSTVDEAERNVTRAVIAILTTSFLVIFGYLVVENLG
jgi:hypothetical protein